MIHRIRSSDKVNTSILIKNFIFGRFRETAGEEDHTSYNIRVLRKLSCVRFDDQVMQRFPESSVIDPRKNIYY